MDDSNAQAWHPVAAYLYVLHLDGPELAWEYLRRHPGYRRAWANRGISPEACRDWGLKLLEDPSLDARDAQPGWLPGHLSSLQLHPDDDPAPEPPVFAFWSIPGHKHLVHDGKRLLLTTRWPGNRRRWELAAELVDGAAYLLAVPGGTCSLLRPRPTRFAFEDPGATGQPVAQGVSRIRPGAPAMLEVHTLQALDAVLAGASQREIATGLFGQRVVEEGWHPDSDLRARVRRLTRRGRALTEAGYRRLARRG